MNTNIDLETQPDNNASSIIEITKHAYERGKERFGWKSNVLYKMAERAYLEGMSYNDTKGRLHRYITKLWLSSDKKPDNIRIYGETVYLFSNKKLITLYKIPNVLKKNIKYSNS